MFQLLKFVLIAAFFFNLGTVRAENPGAKWSESFQATTGKIFSVCDGFEFCRKLNESGGGKDGE